MSIQRNVGVSLAMAAGLAATSSCELPMVHHRRQARVFVPPPPRPKPAPQPVPVIAEAPKVAVDANLGPVPPVPADLGDVPILTEATLGPPPPAPVKRPPVAPPKVQAVAPPPEAPPAVPAPKLGQIFTPEEQRQYSQALADSFARVDSALARLEGKRLTEEQVETADRIRTFRKQAEQAREQDLVTAVSLARRADLLAKDLLGRLP